MVGQIMRDENGIEDGHVRLTWDQYELAAIVAARRRAEAIRNGQKHRAPESATVHRAACETDAACAEFAAAMFLKRFWSGAVPIVGQHSDLYPDIDVKHTTYRDGFLIVQEKTIILGRRYLLVVGTELDFWIVGWIWGSEISGRDEWLRETPTRGYWVPQGDLHQISFDRARNAQKEGPDAQTSAATSR